MLAPAKIEQARRLLAEGRLSRRAIALAVGMARSTVSAIADGRRPDYAAARRARADEQRPLTGPLVRCPSCGGLVIFPCRLCRVRALKEHERALARLAREQARRRALTRLLRAIRAAGAAPQPPRRAD